jgi:hypothetical protein
MTVNVATSASDATGRICGRCAHCDHDRHALEAAIPGLTAFGSAFGASVGETRLCRLHDRLVSPADSCGEFVLAGAA